MHSGTSFPVGKVDFLDLHPLSFKEFLVAIKEEELVNLINDLNFDLIKKGGYLDRITNLF